MHQAQLMFVCDRCTKQAVVPQFTKPFTERSMAPEKWTSLTHLDMPDVPRHFCPACSELYKQFLKGEDITGKYADLSRLHATAIAAIRRLKDQRDGAYAAAKQLVPVEDPMIERFMHDGASAQTQSSST